MIDWSTVNVAVKELCARLALEDEEEAFSFKAEDKNRPRHLMSKTHKAALTTEVISIVAFGRDEERSERVPDDATGADAPWAGKVRRVVVGDRKVTYQLAYDAITNTDKTWAWAAIERIRTRLRRESSIAELEAADISINEIGPAQKADFRFERRMVSKVLFTLVLNVHAEDVEQLPGGIIEHVETTSHVRDADGVELPVPPNFTNEMIPPLE